MTIKNILFVCTGNTCRSPIAKVFFSALTNKQSFHAESAGTKVEKPEDAMKHARSAMQELWMDLTTHKSKQVTKELIDSSDLIIVMERQHKEFIEALSPAKKEKIHLLGEYTSLGEIHDPYGTNMEAYRTVTKTIKKAVEGLISHLSTHPI